MTFMSLFNLLSPMTAHWNGAAFFTLRLFLGLASVFKCPKQFGPPVVKLIDISIQGLAMPTIQPLFARWSAPDERGTLIGLAFAGFSLGSAVTFPLSGLLCQFGFAGGWPSIFYLSGI